ncbi:MAG: hypothetical protein F6K30_13080 [Cyanothece sp. SIO2G6]|nr:hypothetical protein [Cyanothece sp. SIO2G6]
MISYCYFFKKRARGAIALSTGFLFEIRDRLHPFSWDNALLHNTIA